MNKGEIRKEKYVDLTEQDWLLSRKKFIRLMILSGLAVQLPWLKSCSVDEEEVPADISPLTLSQYKTIRQLQKILFPSDGNGPGATEINAPNYFLWVLRDPLADADETKSLIKRTQQFIDECKKEMGEDFISLSESQQTLFIKRISRNGWGKRWVSRMLTIIFEALLLDPVYGGNTNECGWKWLDHNPGRPRPTVKLIYPDIMKYHEV